MKQILAIIISILWMNSVAQNVKIEGTLHLPAADRKVYLIRPMQSTEYNAGAVSTVIDAGKGKFLVELNIGQPEIMFLSSWVNNQPEFNTWLFLKEGYTLNLELRKENDKVMPVVSGIGAQNNQQLEISNYSGIMNDSKDTLPENVLAYVQQEYKKDEAALNNYIKKNKPSKEFIEAWQHQIAYAPLKEYYSFAQQRKYYIKEAYKRNIKSWNAGFDQLLKNAPLINEAALNCANYRYFLHDYLTRSKEQLWGDAAVNMDEFINKWYAGDMAKGKEDFNADKVNRPCQKIVEATFTGKVKEYMYAQIIKNALKESIITNLAVVYDDFLKQFPDTKYKKIYDNPVAAVAERLKQPLTQKMMFIPNSDSINSWAEVLAIFKGKTVLLDMWGTWCGPCREEIEKNGAAIKSHFKNKPVDYLYIANYDEGNVEKWKTLVAYFNLEGSHLLATDSLTTDIMKQLKTNSYPTYAIIHKDGSVELSNAGYPMKKDILIAQIEKALK
jgi:thiol-disulfide isomerase/thioredoxin